MRRKQSAKDREIRFSEARCLIHGLEMGQASLRHVKCNHCDSYYPVGYMLVCSRKDCQIYYIADMDHSYAIPKELEHLLNGEV